MSKETVSTDGTTNSSRRGSARTVVASLAAIGGILAASSCCWPVLPFVAAAGFADSSAQLSAARPYLIGASVLSIGYGFYQARRVKKCGRQPRVAASVLLWMSTAFVVMTIFFPQIMASAVATLLAR